MAHADKTPEPTEPSDPAGTQIMVTILAFGAIGLVFFLNEVLPGPGGAKRFYDRGAGYYKERKYDDALRWFSRSIEIDPKYYRSYFARALIYRRDDDIDNAIADYTTVVRLKPDEAAAFYNRGLIYGDIGDPEHALADFEAAKRLKPNDTDPYLRRVAIYRALGDFEHALAEQDELIGFSSQYLPYYFQRAAIRRDQGDLDGAIRDVETAIAISDQAFEPYLERGRLRRENADMAGAIADFERTIALKPDDLRPYLERGHTYAEMGRTDAAKAELDDVIKRSPDRATGYLHRGVTELFTLGQTEAAIEDLDAAVSKGFDYQTVVMLTDTGIAALEARFDLPRSQTDSRPMLAPDVPFFPTIYYAVVWRHLASVRGGQDDAAELATAKRKLGVDSWTEAGLTTAPVRTDRRRRVSWPSHILALFADKTTPDVVRGAAEATPGAYARRLRTCEADFYIAEYHLTKSAGEEARKLLQAAIAECPATAPEAAFAKAELARLGSQAQK